MSWLFVALQENRRTAYAQFVLGATIYINALAIKVDRNEASDSEKVEYEQMLSTIVQDALKETATPMTADEFRHWIAVNLGKDTLFITLVLKIQFF